MSACNNKAKNTTESTKNSSYTQPSSLNKGDWWQPQPGTTWQWQLTDEIDSSYDVDVYNVDLFDTPAEVIEGLHQDGRVVVCYFSAGSREDWRPDADDFPQEVLGRGLQGWPGERWLDIRRIDLLAPVMTARLDLAAAKGCDAVEADNVDAYQNKSGFPLSGDDQLAYNIWLAEQAHRRGLSIGLKNDLDQAAVLEPYFDWALNEQCFEYGECEKLLPFIEAGKAVFGVEYNLEADAFCDEANAMGFSWLRKDPDLGAGGQACWE